MVSYTTPETNNTWSTVPLSVFSSPHSCPALTATRTPRPLKIYWAIASGLYWLFVESFASIPNSLSILIWLSLVVPPKAFDSPVVVANCFSIAKLTTSASLVGCPDWVKRFDIAVKEQVPR